jgi:hypothetical protein
MSPWNARNVRGPRHDEADIRSNVRNRPRLRILSPPCRVDRKPILIQMHEEIVIEKSVNQLKA